MAWITNLLTDNCVHIAHRGMLVLNVFFNVILVLFYTGATWPHLFTDWILLLNSFTIFWNLLHQEVAHSSPIIIWGPLVSAHYPTCFILCYITVLSASQIFVKVDGFFSKGSWKWIYCMGYCKYNHLKHLQNNIRQMRVQQLGMHKEYNSRDNYFHAMDVKISQYYNFIILFDLNKCKIKD